MTWNVGFEKLYMLIYGGEPSTRRTPDGDKKSILKRNQIRTSIESRSPGAYLEKSEPMHEWRIPDIPIQIAIPHEILPG